MHPLSIGHRFRRGVMVLSASCACLSLQAVGCAGDDAGAATTDSDFTQTTTELELAPDFGQGGRLTLDCRVVDLLPLENGDVALMGGMTLRIVNATGGLEKTAAAPPGSVLSRQQLASGKLLYLTDGQALAVYEADGTPDLSFGTNGVVKMGALESPVDVPFSASVAVADASGRVLLAGQLGHTKHYGAAMVRLQADGKIDTTFGKRGFVRLSTAQPSLANYARFSSIHVQADNNILTIAERNDAKGWSPTGLGIFLDPAAVAAFDADGRPLPSFGAGGIAYLARTGVPNHEGELHDASFVVHSSGDLLISGKGSGGNGTRGLARVIPGTGLDPAFGPSDAFLIWDKDNTARLSPDQIRRIEWPAGSGARVLDYQWSRSEAPADQRFCSVKSYGGSQPAGWWLVRRPGFDGFCIDGVAARLRNGMLLVATNYSGPVQHEDAGAQLTLYK